MVYSSQMNNIKAGKEITNLQKIYRKFGQFIEEDDRAYIRDYISVALEMAGNNQFDETNADALRGMPWSEVGNFRYGWWSIRGFTGEVLTAGIWNRANWGSEYRTFFTLGDATQETETSGGDLVANNNAWNNSYPIQVKTVESLNEVKIHESWLNYNTQDVQRFVIVDPVRQQMIHLEYLQLLREVEDYSKDPILNLRTLLNIKKATFFD